MNVRHTIAAAALFLFTGATAWAQAAPAPATEAPGRAAILNVRQAIVETAEGKLASAELQSQFATRQTELENIRKQVADLQKRLQDGERTLNDAEKNRLARQIDILQRQFQRKSEDFQEDLTDAQNLVLERIGSKMMDVLDRYCRENAISLVLDVSMQSTPVIYAANTINITPDIVRLYDQAHPVRNAQEPRPPAQPGQTRPPQP